MDLIDVQILRKLTWNPNDPLDKERGLLGAWDIAKELAVHGTTVKRRLEDLEAAGVLRGVHMWPNLAELGYRNALYGFHFASSEDKQAAVDALFEDDTSTDVYNFVGREAWFGLNGSVDDETSVRAAEIADRFGAIAWEELENRTWEHEAPTELELRIIECFRSDAYRPVAEVASEVGVTPLTVRRKLEALRVKRAFILYPSIFPGRMDGVIPFMLSARSTGREATERLLRAFPHAIWRSLVDTHRPYVLLAVEKTPDMAKMLELAEGLDGISECRHLLLESSRPCHPKGKITRVSQIIEA